MDKEKTSIKSLRKEEDNSNSTPHPFFLSEGVRECQKELSPKEVILSLLRARAWKQVDLANAIGMSRQGLHAYISGRWGIPTQIKIKIAAALGVDSSVIWDLKNG